jgi:hypothetical protein
MAQFTIYKSTDASAPALDGTVGSLVNLLDKCLVTGYGAKAAAGWTKPYTGTNKAAFKQGTGSNGFYLRVQDDAPGAGGAKDTRITGYETMSDVDTGTGPFPTAAQGLGGVVAALNIRKSAASDATARTWILAADARTFYIFILTGDIAGIYYSSMFGEIYSFISSDLYRTGIIAANAENSSSSNNNFNLSTLQTALTSNQAGNYLARSHTGLGGSVQFGKHSDTTKTGSATAFVGIVPFTNPADGGVYLAPVWLQDPNTAPVNGLRGRLRGIWVPLHAAASFTDGDTLTGVGELSGKSFLFIKTCREASAGTTGVVVLETSNTLETN